MSKSQASYDPKKKKKGSQKQAITQGKNKKKKGQKQVIKYVGNYVEVDLSTIESVEPMVGG